MVGTCPCKTEAAPEDESRRGEARTNGSKFRSARTCRRARSLALASSPRSLAMRSKAIKLDVKFAEAKACGRLDRPFAVTCLALLRQTCATHTQKELLASIADSLEELIFSRVPSFEGARPLTPGASGGGEYEALAWFELCKRAEEEKREEAMAKEALLLERQQVARSTDSCCTPNLPTLFPSEPAPKPPGLHSRRLHHHQHPPPPPSSSTSTATATPNSTASATMTTTALPASTSTSPTVASPTAASSTASSTATVTRHGRGGEARGSRS